ncbi:hypothetical protein [Nonomuraea sp. LPB2021202275-12-8]|uniref:hypothetical protein n=1 Tax=Nonomuraea sp. LPB2021202275-12-8 TaxID=3120159 RepID=UPI00300C88E4
MGKFDGMDPKLVRDLLAEAKRAAEELRRVEGRVGQIMSGAGLATQTTHRPVQVADAADRMVKDVTGRLGVLEKRAGERDGSRPAVGADAKDDDPKDSKDDRRDKYDNPRTEDGKPETKPDGKTGEDGKPETKPDGKTGEDGKPETKPDGKTGEDDKPDAKPDGKTGEDDKPDAKPDGKTGEDDKPDAKPDGKTGEDDKPDAKPDGKACDDDTSVDEPKDEDRGSRRDQGAEPDRGIADTPAKDHPDDLDATKPQVVVVDGVKVLQVPIDPPTAKQLESLLENLDKVQPLDLPSGADQNGQTDAYADRPAGSGRPIGTDPLVGSDQPGTDRPIGTEPPSGTDQPPSTQPPVGDDAGGCADDGRDGDGGVSPDVQPRDQDVRDTRQDGVGQDGVGQAPRDDGSGLVVPPTAPESGASETGTQSVGSRADGGPPSDPGRGTDASAGVEAWANDGSDVVSAEARPLDLEALGTVIENAREIQPHTMPGVEVPPGEWGEGQWAPENIRPDGPSGSIEPGTAGGTGGTQGADGTATSSGGQSMAADSASGGHSAAVAEAGAGDGVTSVSAGQGGSDGPGSGGNAWADDGSDVVSVDVEPPDQETLQALVANARDVQPMEMPTVEVPPGEWGRGAWLPEDIEPDGPPGSLDPGTPERSA